MWNVPIKLRSFAALKRLDESVVKREAGEDAKILTNLREYKSKLLLALPHVNRALLGLPEDAGRLEVAYAIALRRRKGTPAALEDFAEVLTDWTVRVLEGWQITVWAQRLRHPPPLRVAAFDLRDGSRFRVGTPFERGGAAIQYSVPNWIRCLL